MAKHKRQYNCTCTAYPYPHRLLSGKCKGLWVLEQTIAESHFTNSECKTCSLRDSNGCQVLEGRESSYYCEVMQNFLRANSLNRRGEYRKS